MTYAGGACAAAMPGAAAASKASIRANGRFMTSSLSVSDAGDPRLTLAQNKKADAEIVVPPHSDGPRIAFELPARGGDVSLPKPDDGRESGLVGGKCLSLPVGALPDR